MKSRMLMAMGAALLVGACSGISTTTDYDPQVDFSGFSTYDWVDSEQSGVDNITSSRIRQSVDGAMVAKGFSQSSSNPDLAISYQVSTDERRSFNTVNAGWGGGYGWGGWGHGHGNQHHHRERVAGGLPDPRYLRHQYQEPGLDGDRDDGHRREPLAGRSAGTDRQRRGQDDGRLSAGQLTPGERATTEERVSVLCRGGPFFIVPPATAQR